ncbi:MAG TPA: glycosyltransferase family 2 protein [Ignavibacteria bacterium]|nr:glycosyltransferase family 2 protein [Ignavibacteria bacterium]
MTTDSPLVSITILSYNRKESLRQTLNKVIHQDYKNIEIIVVDNFSSDGSPEMIKHDFPFVKIIQLDQNIGAVAFNKGFNSARGKYILVLDDDSYPLNETINKGINVFSTNPKIGIVSYEIYNTLSNKSETDNFVQKGLSFIGCGVLISKEVLDKLNGYCELYFMFHNELDFAIRTLKEGYQIKYLSGAKIIHDQKAILNREGKSNSLISEFRYYNYFVSYSIFLIKNFSFRNYSLVLLKWFLNRFIICFKYPYFKVYVKAIIKIFSNLNMFLNDKEEIPLEIQKLYFNMIPFIDRDYFPNFSKPSFKLFR